MGEIECSEKCGNLTNTENADKCNICIESEIEYVAVVKCTRCGKLEAENNTRHYCSIENKNLPRGRFGHPTVGLWID